MGRHIVYDCDSTKYVHFCLDVGYTRNAFSFVGCPLLTFTMPKTVYCTFDSMCLGLECCINLKFAIFLKVFKVWARFDPCTTPMLFSLGLDSLTYKIEIPVDSSYEGILNIDILCN